MIGPLWLDLWRQAAAGVVSPEVWGLGEKRFSSKVTELGRVAICNVCLALSCGFGFLILQ